MCIDIAHSIFTHTHTHTESTQNLLVKWSISGVMSSHFSPGKVAWKSAALGPFAVPWLQSCRLLIFSCPKVVSHQENL